VCVLVCGVVLRCGGTHAGVLLEFVQEVLGGNEVVQEVAKTVVLIGRLQHRKDLNKWAKRRRRKNT